MDGFVTKLSEILSTIYGWLLCLSMVVIDYFAGYEATVQMATMAVVMDCIWGIAAAHKQGKFTLSELARNTFSKLSVYGCCIVLFIGIDRLMGLQSGLTTSAICIGIVLTEAWSTCASMLICFPDLPFLKLLKRALTGEIARKLGVDADKVDEVLGSLS
jgi:hypothetical protein